MVNFSSFCSLHIASIAIGVVSSFTFTILSPGMTALPAAGPPTHCLFHACMAPPGLTPVTFQEIAMVAVIDIKTQRAIICFPDCEAEDGATGLAYHERRCIDSRRLTRRKPAGGQPWGFLGCEVQRGLRACHGPSGCPNPSDRRCWTRLIAVLGILHSLQSLPVELFQSSRCLFFKHWLRNRCAW